MRSTVITTVSSFIVALVLSSVATFAQGKSAMSPTSPTKPTPTPAAQPAKAAAQTTKEEPKKAEPAKAESANTVAQPAAAQSVKAEPSKTAAKTDDASLTTAVKEKLSSMPSLKDAKIDATVKDGVATLTGSVKAPGLKGVATNAAKRVTGVKSVTNNITIDKPAKDDKKEDKKKDEPKK